MIKTLSYYNFELSITVNETLYGTVEVDDKSSANAEVTMLITPNTGYIIDTIEVIDNHGNLIPVTENKFIMPEEDVYITVNYKATVDNPETDDLIIFVVDSSVKFDDEDKELLESTGGIIQGMSGSPIIQNGKLIGAVTHVFLNDPTGGYGIFAEN